MQNQYPDAVKAKESFRRLGEALEALDVTSSVKLIYVEDKNTILHKKPETEVLQKGTMNNLKLIDWRNRQLV